MLCKCGKLFSHNYKAYSCSELNVRIPLLLLQATIENIEIFTNILVTEHSTYSSCVAQKFNQIEGSPHQISSVFKYGDQASGAYAGRGFLKVCEPFQEHLIYQLIA